jgi:putative ABC transport system permease protein
MMNLRKIILRSFFHYFRANILAAAGLAVATAVITGAFITGDSLSHSLEKTVIMRLGNISHSITAGERLFTMEMGNRFSQLSGMPVSRGLVAEGMAAAEGGSGERLNRIQVLGVDGEFSRLLGTGFQYSGGGPGEVIISENMARRLNLQAGDFFRLRMKRTGLIPMNTPLVSDADQTVSRRVRVAAVAGDGDYGRFNLQVSQTAPFNVFADIGWLNMVMGLEGMANILFIASPASEIAGLERFLEGSWDIEDVNLTLSRIPGEERLGISSERVFIEDHLSSGLTGLFPESIPFLTYFVNSIEKAEKSTPYSFVTAGGRYPLEHHETVISRWLADDLSAGVGDSLLMRYWETGARRELKENKTWLVVKGIAEMEHVAPDSILMPHLPGLSDAGNCRDWDTGVPVELGRIRGKDELYWDDYRGTPKAYISLSLGQQLWTNRFGNLTSLWLPGEMDDPAEVRGMIRSAVRPAQSGFRVNELRERGLQSAAGGVDFGMLFGALGFFVMLAGVMLFFLLQLFNMEKRAGQIRLFSALGYPPKMVREIYLGEGMLVAMAGTLSGLLLAVLYGKMVHWALSGMWQDIVRTGVLEMVVRPLSLLTGFTIGISIAFLVIIPGINRHILKKPASLTDAGKKGGPHPGAFKNTRYRIPGRLIAAALLTLAGAVVLLRQLTRAAGWDPVGFFFAGGLLVPAFLLFLDALLLWLEEKNYSHVSMTMLSMKNLVRNRTRSLSVIILLALGIFTVIAAGSHRKDAAASETQSAGGTGGFLFVTEATVPVLYDLNSREARMDLNIPPGLHFVQFMASYADDASCLNLNQVANPRILSVNPSQLRGRFSFAKGTDRLGSDDPWQSLEAEIAGSRTGGTIAPLIPAVADQAVIQWGLGKKVGDTLTYTDERGRELRLLLVGGLANSVFQGNVIISEKHFLRHFPSASGSSFFLVEGARESQELIKEELEFIFRDHGWEMETASGRLNRFNAIENTYLGIFLVLGALGLLLGVVGLAVVMARSIVERKNEIALYISLGYERTQITAILAGEYATLLVLGLLAGVPPALVAGLPSLLGSQSVNPAFPAFLAAAIFLNGMFWIVLTARLLVKKGGIVTALRND